MACIEWNLTRNRQGYGLVKREGRMWRAHRWVWTQVHGPIPEGMMVLHACDNPPCVNIEHLFLGTAADNAGDMVAKGRNRNQNTTKTECPRGHEYTPENTYMNRGRRFCRACATVRRQAWLERQAS